VIFSAFEELEHPVVKALVSAVTEPISDIATATAPTHFEKLCASKPLPIDNAFFEESRAGKS